MSFHARPIPAPANVPGGRHDPARPQVRLSALLDDPPSTLPVTAGRSVTPEAVAATPAAEIETPSRPAASEAMPHVATTTATESATPWPWYRREPWVPVILAAFVPIGVCFALPQGVHLPLLALSGLLVVLSAAMLIRQGLFREHPRPEATRGEDARAARRRAA